MLRIIWLVSNHKLVKIYNLVKCMGIVWEFSVKKMDFS